MAFAPFAAITDSNPLPVVVVTASVSFDPFAPISLSNPLPVVGTLSTADFLPYAPITETNPQPLVVVQATGSFSSYLPISETNPLPVVKTTAPGAFNKFLPVSSTNPLPVFEPGLLANLALWLDTSDLASLSYDGSNRVALVSDKSGNSAENCLVLNGVSGNYVTSPDSAAVSAPSALDVEADLAANDYTNAANQFIGGQSTGIGNQRSYYLGIQTSGKAILVLSKDGATVTTIASTLVLPASDLGRIKFRATWDGATGTVLFYTRSSSNEAWSPLGDPVASGVTGTLFNSSGVVSVGANGEGTALLFSGRIYSFRIRTSIGGVVAIDADFTRVAKLAGSFTEQSSNAATVTINASGTTGARICGARDAYQSTSGNKPILAQGAVNYLTFDGLNDFLKTAPFSLSQPATVYFVGSQETWTDADGVYDGNTLLGMSLRQAGTTPGLLLNAGTSIGPIEPPTGTRFISRGIYNGALSSIGYNRNGAVTGNANTNTAGGFIVGARGDLSNPGNITFSEVLIFSAAHDEATQLNVARHLIRKWKIAA